MGWCEGDDPDETIHLDVPVFDNKKFQSGVIKIEYHLENMFIPKVESERASLFNEDGIKKSMSTISEEEKRGLTFEAAFRRILDDRPCIGVEGHLLVLLAEEFVRRDDVKNELVRLFRFLVRVLALAHVLIPIMVLAPTLISIRIRTRIPIIACVRILVPILEPLQILYMNNRIRLIRLLELVLHLPR